VEPNFADDLLSAIEEKGPPVCVGLDPVWGRLPEKLKHNFRDEVERLEPIGEFCYGVLDAVAPIVPAVKLQSACFERYGPAGMDLMRMIVRAAQDLGLIVIGDVKRADIGATAQAYAEGHMKGLFDPFGATTGVPDAITVNPYFGTDGIQPFVDVAAEEDRGVFILVRTSNPSAREIQDIADAGGRKVYEHVAAMVARMGDGEDLLGQRGYSCVGAVVGATYPQEARRLREMMPRQIFLVPGYGAQGATAADCAAAFKADGTGAIVNASRSVIFAYADPKRAGQDWRKAVESAARQFADDIRKAVGK
jgi:orotidine-5'-phosphate decarboxylase